MLAIFLLQMILNELFPTIFDAVAHGYVIRLIVGLMQNPQPMVDHIHGLYKKMLLTRMRSGMPEVERTNRLQVQGMDVNNSSLFASLYAESRVQLPGTWTHNHNWNMYNHLMNDRTKTPRDKTPIFTPSKLYLFYGMKEDVECEMLPRKHETDAEEITECAILIDKPDAEVTKSVLSTCHRISSSQPLTDLWIERVEYKDLVAPPVPVMSRNTRSLTFSSSVLPTTFLRDLMHQLSGCTTVESLQFWDTDLHEVEEDLIDLLVSFPSPHWNLNIRGTGLSSGFLLKLKERKSKMRQDTE